MSIIEFDTRMNDNILHLTHLDKDKKASMVDISEKSASARIAIAQSIVRFPQDVFQRLYQDQFLNHKGSIIQTATLAGIMAAKQTANLIPLCHTLHISKAQVDISIEENQLRIEAMVKCEAKTGVEMEALTAASIAALTIYDMCKVLSHDIEIVETKLIAKKGGKYDFQR